MDQKPQRNEDVNMNTSHKTREQIANYVVQEALETFSSIKQIIMAMLWWHGHH